jgi:DNA-binding XRE family transcriptional regulator
MKLGDRRGVGGSGEAQPRPSGSRPVHHVILAHRHLRRAAGSGAPRGTPATLIASCGRYHTCCIQHVVKPIDLSFKGLRWSDVVAQRSATADQALAAAVRSLREQRGWTQERLAWEAELTVGSLARIELGQADPRWSTVMGLVDALGISLADLVIAVDKQRRRRPR